MRRLALKIVGWTLSLYLGFLTLTLGIEAVMSQQYRTISLYRDYPRSIYANTPHYAVYGMDRLDNHPRQLFILGGSVSGRGFDPDLLMKELPHYKAHNLSISASNVSQIVQVIDMLEEHVHWQHLDSAVFVFGGHFVSFLDNRRKFDGPTPVDTEKLRHHLYRQELGVIKPVFVGKLMNVAVFLIKPFAFFYKLNVQIRSLRGHILDYVKATTPESAGEDADIFRAPRNAQFHNEGLTDEQFVLFMDLVGRLSAGGAKIVFVDLPVRSAFREGFPIFDEYRVRVKRIIQDPRISYLDMTDFAPDSQFRDDAHSFPEAIPAWTSYLAAYVKNLATVQGLKALNGRGRVVTDDRSRGMTGELNNE